MAAAAVAAPSPALKTRDPKDDSAPRNDDPDFISAVMRAHWYWRRLHCAQDLVWDPELADKAQNDVNKCPQHQTHVSQSFDTQTHPYPSLFICNRGKC